MLFDAVLYIVTSAVYIFRPISSWAVLVDVAFCQFSNNPPNFASVDDAITFLNMLHSTCTGPSSGIFACIGVLDFVPRKKYPTALLLASDSDM